MGKILNHPKFYSIFTILSIVLFYFLLVVYSHLYTNIEYMDIFVATVSTLPFLIVVIPLICFGIVLFYEWQFENNKKIEDFSGTVSIILAILIVIIGLLASIPLHDYFNGLEEKKFYGNVFETVEYRINSTFANESSAIIFVNITNNLERAVNDIYIQMIYESHVIIGEIDKNHFNRNILEKDYNVSYKNITTNDVVIWLKQIDGKETYSLWFEIAWNPEEGVVEPPYNSADIIIEGKNIL